PVRAFATERIDLPTHDDGISTVEVDREIGSLAPGVGTRVEDLHGSKGLIETHPSADSPDAPIENKGRKVMAGRRQRGAARPAPLRQIINEHIAGGPALTTDDVDLAI